uniref:Uncharacterized protein n=1 Tax=Kalanchoe fedtschenkoi TaxID=63787 RepID=A0A7N0VNB6_KALFE
MDFYGLPRKQLQALCKQNKIPANMTNVAMADALSALDHVEGLEEVVQLQSARKAEAGSPEVPRTGTSTRISTRARKAVESSGTVSLSGAMTSGKLVDDDAVAGSPEVPRTGTRISTRLRKAALESGGAVQQSGARTNRKLMNDDEGEDEKKEVGKTPAVASSRKRGTAETRRKTEAPSLQKAYSTRRSVRLLENKLSELCLGESGKRNQPIKIDDELSSEMTESDVKGDDVSEKCAEEALHNDEVNSSEVPDQPEEAVDSVAVVLANEVSSNGTADEVAIDVVEKAMAEDFTEEAAHSRGSDDAKKDSKITSVGVYVEVPSPLVDAVDSAAVIQINGVSSNGTTDTGVVEKAMAGDFAQEAVQAMIANDDVSVEVPAPVVDDVDSAVVVQVSEVSCKDTTDTEGVEKAIAGDFSGEAVQAMIASDGVSVERSASLVDAVDGAAVVRVNEVLSNGVTDMNATEEVENTAEEAVEAMDSADSEKDLDNAGVEQVNEISSYGATDKDNGVASYGINDIVASEEVGKSIGEDFATGVSGLVTVEVVCHATPEIFEGQTLPVSVVAFSPGSSEKEAGNARDEQTEEEVLKSPAKHDIKDGNDDFFDLEEAPLRSTAATEDQTAGLHVAGPEPGSLNAVMDVIIEAPASQSPQLVVVMEENETTFQIDESDYDADSMTCQLGSPYHLSDLVEDAAEDLKPQDSSNTEELMENFEFSVDNKDTLIDSSEPIMKLDTERSVTVETTMMTPLSIKAGNPVLGADRYPKAPRSVQRSAFREAAPSTDDVNKENVVNSSLMNEDSIKKPIMNYETMSMRQLRKMVKAMNISDIEDEENKTKSTVKPHQDTPRPRQALKTLPYNSQA